MRVADPGLVLRLLLVVLLPAVRERHDRALVVRARALAHERPVPIALEVRDGHDWRVDRQLLVVHPEAVPVRVGVREQARLQHGVRGGLDAGHGVRGRERGLLDLREVVLRVLVEHELPERTQRELRVRPDLGQVEHVVAELLGLRRGHGLHIGGPRRELLCLDRLEEALGAVVGVITAEPDGGIVIEGLQTRSPRQRSISDKSDIRCKDTTHLESTISPEVDLDVHPLAVLADELVRVPRVTVLVVEAVGGAAVREQDQNLMGRLGVLPKVILWDAYQPLSAMDVRH